MTWADADYHCRKKITIDKDMVLGTNNNFPVLISIASDDDLKDNVKSANGYDIVFYASDDSTLLNHEIEYYNNTTGKYIAWVSVPTVSSAADTDIYIYYSKTGVVADPSSTSTWDANYKMVQHMSDLTTSTTKDSTSNGYNGTKVGANAPIVTTSGKIYNAQDFDGSDDGILIGDGTVGALTTCAGTHTCTSPWTISAWIKKEAASQTSVVLARTDDYWWDKYGVGLICKTTYACGQSEYNNDNATVNANMNDTNWHYVVVIVNAATGRIYDNGVQIATGTLNSGNNYRLWIGKQNHDGGTAYPFNGIIDEVRTSNIERSADWIHTEHHNQNDPSTFYSVGVQEARYEIALTDTVNVKETAKFNGYSYYKVITVDYTKVVNTDLTNFPVLIDVTDIDLKDTGNGGHVTSSSGYDIVFFDSDGHQLSHELDYYVNTTGHLVVWVKTDVSHTDDTVFYMYYGNSAIVTNQSSTDTWDANYKFVHHANDLTTSSINDSTSNNNDGTKKAANEPVESTTAQIGKDQDFDGSNDYIGFTYFAPPTNFTAEFWCNTDADAGSGVGLCWAGQNASGLLMLYSNGLLFQNRNDTNVNVFAIGDSSDLKGAWHHIVGTRTGTTWRIYKDGIENANIADKTLSGTFATLEIGCYNRDGTPRTYFHKGLLDEVRISDVERSADWIHTQYHNQSSPSTFLSVGDEQQPPLEKVLGIGRNLSDTITVAESLVRVKTINRVLNDTITIAESILLEGIVHLIQIILNDTIDVFDKPIGGTVYGSNSLTLRPMAIGTHTENTPSAGDNWECVNEAVKDNDTSYIKNPASAIYTKDTYQIENHTYECGDQIASITVHAEAKRTTATLSYIKLVFLIDGTEYDSSGLELQNGYIPYSAQVTLNPHTNHEWTWSDVDNLEIGVSLLGNGDADICRVTQVWATVEYNYDRTIVKGINRNINDTINVSDSLVRTFIYERIFDDTVNVSEDLVRELAYERVLLDTINISDNLVRTFDYERSFSDMINISELLAKTKGINITLDDTINISDLLAKLKAITITLNDTITVSELMGKEKTINRILGDTVTIAELLGRAKVINRILGDTINISELLGKVKTINRAFNDTINVSELLGKVKGINITLDDTINISELLGKVKTINITLDDTINISDLLSRVKEIFRILNDTINVSESLVKIKVISIVLDDTINVSELLSKIKGIAITLNDTINISESLVKWKGISIAIDDTINISELLGKVKGIFKVLDDTINVSESIAHVKTINRNLSDTINIVESLSRVKGIFRNLDDTINVSESLVKWKGIGIILGDTIEIAESLNKVKGIFRNLNDTIIISESLTRAKVISRTLNDIITVAESLSKIRGRFIVLSDTVNVSESMIKAKVINRILSDTINISESLARVFTYERAFNDIIEIAESLAKSKAIFRVLSDTIKVSEVIQILGVEYFTITWDGGMIEFQHHPYCNGVDMNLDFDFTNLAFKSGNYASYVNEINDEKLVISGFEDTNALTKLTTLNGVADAGKEITVSNVGIEYDGIYIIEGVMYKPISLDIFEYSLTLKFVRRV